MTEEQKQAFKTVIEYFDKQMEESPNSQIANTCNYLQEELEKNE